MAYKLKPNYHFASGEETGIDKVPLCRFIIVESFGNSNEIIWFKKVTNIMTDSNGSVIGTLTSDNTINDAYQYNCLKNEFDTKRDVADSYSITEIQALQSLYRELADSYSITECDESFRRIEDSHTIQEVDAMVNEKQKKFITSPLSSKGKIGDKLGDVAMDKFHIYYCYEDYTNGQFDIWSRIALENTATW